ncbi:unnamed protein product [Caenorhabditis bovis]|uniref:Uncharacterized protein n=1 Tax=Caenorhabditis bovis TaxID=2654633 RepID=A0A8S1FAR9_9PELO|nr:unnamed protein product [Caenorhabditis bovis]
MFRHPVNTNNKKSVVNNYDAICSSDNLDQPSSAIGSAVLRRHSSSIKTYDAVEFRERLKRGSSLDDLPSQRVSILPQPNSAPNRRHVVFVKNRTCSIPRNILRKASNYTKLSSLARVAWVSLTISASIAIRRL